MFHKSWKSGIICLRISAAMEQLLLDTIVISFAKTNVSLLQKNLWPISTVLNDFIQQAKEKALADVPCQTQGQSQSVHANSLRAYSAPVSGWVHHLGLWKICLGSFKVNLAFAENTEGWSLNLNSTKVLSSQRSWIRSLGEISFVFSISISWDLCLRNQVGSNNIFCKCELFSVFCNIRWSLNTELSRSSLLVSSGLVGVTEEDYFFDAKIRWVINCF